MWKARKQEDIEKINIYPNLPGFPGWQVDILYTDGKAATFRVDHAKGANMLRITADAINRQLCGKPLFECQKAEEAR